MPITLETIVCQCEAPVSVEVDGEVLMMSVETGNFYGLDEVAGFIWRFIAQPSSVSAVCDAVEAKFDVERARCEADALAFLDEMVNNGLVRRVDHPVI